MTLKNSSEREKEVKVEFWFNPLTLQNPPTVQKTLANLNGFRQIVAEKDLQISGRVRELTNLATAIITNEQNS